MVFWNSPSYSCGFTVKRDPRFICQTIHFEIVIQTGQYCGWISLTPFLLSWIFLLKSLVRRYHTSYSINWWCRDIIERWIKVHRFRACRFLANGRIFLNFCSFPLFRGYTRRKLNNFPNWLLRSDNVLSFQLFWDFLVEIISLSWFTYCWVWIQI